MIIGLHGESRAGKDTIAGILHEKYDYEWRQFAKNLRDILMDINPYLHDGTRYRDAVHKHGLDVVKKTWPEAVDYMISLGQGVRDLVHEDAWTWGPLSDVPENLVISDVRQPNEADKILEMGGELWLIKRPGSQQRGMDGLLSHYGFDVVINNVGSLEQLVDVVDAVMEDSKYKL